MLQFEWPHKWSEQDCESVRIAIERSIRDAMARGSGNAQIRGLVNVDTPNLGKRAPKIKLEGIRCLSLNRTAINLHIQYDGDFEITLRGLQVNLDTLNTSSTNDLDGSKAMPFFCPFVLTVTNLVLDGMASVEIRQEVQRDWTGLHQISPTLDAFMQKNSTRQSRYEYYSAHNHKEHVNGLRGNKKHLLQKASQHALEHASTENELKHRQLVLERKRGLLPTSRNLATSDDNLNTTTFEEAEYRDRHKSMQTQLSSYGTKQENEISQTNYRNQIHTLIDQHNDKLHQMPDRCVSIRTSESTTPTETPTSNRAKLGYGVLFAAGGRHAMRKPHAQQSAFTGLEHNHNDEEMEHRYGQQISIHDKYYNEIHHSGSQRMHLGNNSNRTCKTMLHQTDTINSKNNKDGCNVNDSYMYGGRNCVEFSRRNADLTDETLMKKTLLNNEKNHHHEECYERKHYHSRKEVRLCSIHATNEEELYKSLNSNYRINDSNNNYRNKAIHYINHSNDNINNNIHNDNDGDDYVYDDNGGILSANVIDLLCHKVKITKRVIKVQLFGDPLKSFSVISNFGTVPGVDNRVQETIKMLIKPIIERMMLDGLTIVREANTSNQ